MLFPSWLSAWAHSVPPFLEEGRHLSPKVIGSLLFPNPCCVYCQQFPDTRSGKMPQRAEMLSLPSVEKKFLSAWTFKNKIINPAMTPPPHPSLPFLSLRLPTSIHGSLGWFPYALKIKPSPAMSHELASHSITLWFQLCGLPQSMHALSWHRAFSHAFPSARDLLSFFKLTPAFLSYLSPAVLFLKKFSWHYNTSLSSIYF